MIIVSLSFGQLTQYTSAFDYKSINTQTYIPIVGWNSEQKHLLTILKHSFEMQQIIAHARDTSFVWNGIKGEKTTYTKDSLILFFIRPADTITRPCILITHGNNAEYRSSWHDNLKFLVIDLAMRGYSVAYYENPSGREATQIRLLKNNHADSLVNNSRIGLYNGFQSAVAADIFIVHNALRLKIDTTKLFAGGYSFGAYTSLALATANDGQNFKDAIFHASGGFNANAIYNDPYTKNIQQVFAIGGALPKDDTVNTLNSNMGEFLDESDANVSLLFLHGITDHLISFNLTTIKEADSTKGNFLIEGPSALINKINDKHLPIVAKLIVNCKGGHNFTTSVCGYSNPYCMAQWHWLHLAEPPDTLIFSSNYFTNISTDSMLRYAAYMLTQVSDMDFMIADFFQPTIYNTTSALSQPLYFVQPQDSFKYTNANGHYMFKNTDCDGKPFVITAIKDENVVLKDEVKIYPNPASVYITFEAKENMEQISIYNMLGALIQQIQPQNLQQQINIQDWVTGEYIVVIQLKNRLVTMKISLTH